MQSHNKILQEIKLNEGELENKISIFANEDGLIDSNSIYYACIKKFHLEEEKAYQITINMLWGAWLVGIPGMSYSFFSSPTGFFKPKDAIPLFLLSYDGGLYNKDGSPQERLFKRLEKYYAVEDWDGEKIISKSKMIEFIEKETHQSTRLNNASWSYQNFGITGNKGTFEIFFDKLSTRHKINRETKENENYVTFNNLKLWYFDSKHVVKQIETRSVSTSYSI